MGNEQELINENNNRELKRAKTKANFDDINNENKTAEEYDNEMSRMLFDDEFKEENHQEKAKRENKKTDKKTEFKNYAKEIEEEKFMEEINRVAIKLILTLMERNNFIKKLIYLEIIIFI